MLIHKAIRLLDCIYNNVMLWHYGAKEEHGKVCINGKVRIYGQKNAILFGSGITINSGKGCNPIGGDTRTFLYTMNGGSIYIGNEVGISNSSLVANAGNIIIGKDVLIGNSCKLYTSDFHPINADDRKMGKNDRTKSGDIKICDGVFIGAHSIILKNVTIGENSVIGAGSVVSHNVPPNEIWGGSPAKFIRKI